MHKTDLIEAITKDTEISKADTAKVVNSLFETIALSLKKGESVSIIGFGGFRVTKLKARKGRDLHTGETIKIAARKAPKFKASSTLKLLVRGKAPKKKK